MFAYGEDGRCLMQALQSELDDPRAEPCGRCAVCAGPRFDAPVDAGLAREAYALVRSRPIVLTVRRQTPRTADQAGQADRARSSSSRRAARSRRAGDGGWDGLVRAGPPRRPLRRRARAGLRRPARPLAPDPGAGVGHRGAVAPLGRARARLRGSGSPARSACPTRRCSSASGDNPPQREMANSAQQVANVRGEFRVLDDAAGGPGLLVDDVRYSGWTLATVGAQLRMKGAGPVHPLVLSLAGA